jgi:hypothetical protein
MSCARVCKSQEFVTLSGFVAVLRCHTQHLTVFVRVDILRQRPRSARPKLFSRCLCHSLQRGETVGAQCQQFRCASILLEFGASNRARRIKGSSTAHNWWPMINVRAVRPSVENLSAWRSTPNLCRLLCYCTSMSLVVRVDSG